MKAIIGFTAAVVIALAVMFSPELLKRSGAGFMQSDTDRLFVEGRDKMLKECTNSVVGIQKVIEIKYDPYLTNDPDGLTYNSITVDYLNARGGMSRTNIPFVFTTGQIDSVKYIECGEDIITIAHRQYPDLYSKNKK